MSQREYIIRDKIGDGGTLVLVTAEDWVYTDVKQFLDNPDWEVFEFTHYEHLNITDKTEVMSTEEWFDRYSTKK
ncbi:MAG: hypothetical protein HOB70_00010 [Chloroflexi bacterium]|jgi:hypothetical protein|nr:hypothetical protein [Bacteroidota bacterium]MBT4681407.1 hypothetical protein [Chloroflexota bacterium]